MCDGRTTTTEQRKGEPMTSTRMRKVVSISVGALMLAACGGDDSDAQTSENTSDGTATPTEAAAATTAPAAPEGPDLSVFAGKTIGVVSLAPGLEPVDRITGGVDWRDSGCGRLGRGRLQRQQQHQQDESQGCNHTRDVKPAAGWCLISAGAHYQTRSSGTA